MRARGHAMTLARRAYARKCTKDQNQSDHPISTKISASTMPVKAVQERQTFEDLVAAKRRSHCLRIFFCLKEPLMQFASGNKRCLCRRLFLDLLLLLPPKSRCLLPAFQPAALVHPGRITVPVSTPLPTPATRLHHPAKALKRRRSPAGPQ